MDTSELSGQQYAAGGGGVGEGVPCDGLASHPGEVEIPERLFICKNRNPPFPL